MSKYKVGEELITIHNPEKEARKLREMTGLNVNNDYAQLTWGIRIVDIQYDNPNVTLTYKNPFGEENKVFARCLDVENFDHEKVLEKALLKAFQNEIVEITARKTLKFE